MSQLLRSSRVGVHQKVAHLSYARPELTPEQRNWRFVGIATEIYKTLNVFSQLVPDSKVSDHFRKLVLQPVDEVICKMWDK